VAVGATILLAALPWLGGGQPSSSTVPADGGPLQHAPTGRVTGMYTDGLGSPFRYYDGTDRTAS
jgi:hypothetical protein